MLTPLTSDVESGIGTTKNALSAPTDGSSTPMEDVCPLMTTATPTIQLVPVLLATKDTA
jgi:hypothetical protein